MKKTILSTLLCLIIFCIGLKADTKNAIKLVLPPATVTAHTVTLFWFKPEDYKGIKHYQIYQDGKAIAQSEATNYTVKNMQASVQHTYQIKAVYSNGKQQAVSNKLEIKTKALSKIFNIVDYGAVADGKTLNTIAIQKAIEDCTKDGTVYIPKGEFLSGALFLKSDMTFYIEKGGVLQGSLATKDYYPLVYNRFEGWELTTFASLLNGGRLNKFGSYSIENLSITGEGKIKGGGTTLGNAMIEEKGMRGRGRLILLMNALNVNISGIITEAPPCWNIHYIYSKNVTLHDLTIVTTARNGDGIDPDSSSDSYIFNCSFDTGDDCIAIKSGKNPEGYFIAKPSENIYITNCNFINGHGMSIGSEMSGGVKNILVRDCKAGNLKQGLQIKGTKDRGGYVENVTVQDCEFLKVIIRSNVPYNNDGDAAPVIPYFKDFVFENINMSAAQPNTALIAIDGFDNKENFTKNVSFKNVLLPKGAEINLKNCENFDFVNVKTVDGKKPKYILENTLNIKN